MKVSKNSEIPEGAGLMAPLGSRTFLAQKELASLTLVSVSSLSFHAKERRPRWNEKSFSLWIDGKKKKCVLREKTAQKAKRDMWCSEKFELKKEDWNQRWGLSVERPDWYCEDPGFERWHYGSTDAKRPLIAPAHHHQHLREIRHQWLRTSRRKWDVLFWEMRWQEMRKQARMEY